MRMFECYRADIDRYAILSGRSRLYHLFMDQGLWALAEYRFSRWCLTRVRVPIIRGLLIWYGVFWHKWVQITTGIDLPCDAEIGKGLYIGHFGGIIVSGGAKMGEYCNLSQGVTIGFAGRHGNRGCPNIGDRVYIAAGAKVIGPISIGNDVAIGANAVVTKDLPDMAVAVGIPAKVISYEGSGDFVHFKGSAKDMKSRQDQS